MAIVASSYLTKGSAVIVLQNTVPFTTALWDLQTLDSELPSLVNLAYGLNQNGIGTLSESDHKLTIFIPVCPYNAFRLTVGTFKKIFDLTESGLKWSINVVAANSVKTVLNRIGAATISTTFPSAFIAFSNIRIPPIKGGSNTARLYKDGKFKAYVFGTGFHSVTNNGSRTVWPYSGIIFTRFIWVDDIPSNQEDYEIRIEVSHRGGRTETIDSNVTLSTTSAIAPTSTVFNIQPEHTFQLDGVSP